MSVCNCLAVNHASHRSGRCEEPATSLGGICTTCRWPERTLARLYLAGPMTGIAQFNIPAFDAAAAQLRSLGYEVVSPAELDGDVIRAKLLASSDGRDDLVALTGETWGDFLARDVKVIADGGIQLIVVLDGWERSRGARLETFVGHALCGLPVKRIAGDMLADLHGYELVPAWSGRQLLNDYLEMTA